MKEVRREEAARSSTAMILTLQEAVDGGSRLSASSEQGSMLRQGRDLVRLGGMAFDG